MVPGLRWSAHHDCSWFKQSLPESFIVNGKQVLWVECLVHSTWTWLFWLMIWTSVGPQTPQTYPWLVFTLCSISTPLAKWRVSPSQHQRSTSDCYPNRLGTRYSIPKPILWLKTASRWDICCRLLASLISRFLLAGLILLDLPSNQGCDVGQLWIDPFR